MDKRKKHIKYFMMLVLLGVVIALSFSNYFVFVGTNAIINAIAVMGIVITFNSHSEIKGWFVLSSGHSDLW